MSDSITAAIAAAKANAGAAVANLPPGPISTSTEVVVQGQAQSLSLMDVATSARKKVDHYLKVTEDGIKVGKDSKFMFEELPVTIDMTTVTLFWGVRADKTYRRSYNRVTEDGTGQPWASVVAESRRLDPKCKGDYKGADIAMTLTADLKDAKGVTIAAAGEVLGYTTSITGFGPFQELVAELNGKGLLQSTIAGTAKHAARNGNGNNWGVIEFPGFEPHVIQ